MRLPLCFVVAAAHSRRTPHRDATPAPPTHRWCPPRRLPPRTRPNISIITEFHSTIAPSDDVTYRTRHFGGPKLLGSRYVTGALARFAYWHLVVAGFSEVHVVVTHLRDDPTPLAMYEPMPCVAAWRATGRLTFSTAPLRRACRNGHLECRKVRAIRNAYARLRAGNEWIAYGDVDELFYAEDGRLIAREMASYPGEVKSVCAPVFVYHDASERDLPHMRARVHSGYGFRAAPEPEGGQGDCWKSIHRTAFISRPGLHVSDDSGDEALNRTRTETPWRARSLKRGQLRVAHLRAKPKPEQFPDATVSDDVLSRLEAAALARA